MWVALLGIGGGVKEPVHSFDNPEAAEAYRKWVAERVGEECYIAEVPVSSTWAEPVIEWITAV